MRQLARRFAAREQFNNQTFDCRLIAQPIDRYSSESPRILDGAIFALANGTNPEIGIVLECDVDRWQYGIVRLSSAEAVVTLDGERAAAFEKFNSGGRTDGPYNSGSYRLEMSK